MKPVLLATVATILILGGCNLDDSDITAATNSEAELQPTRNFQQEVLDLPEAQRNGVFIRAIRDAGLPCQGVTESERIDGALLTYRARCESGRDHIVTITSDGTAQIVTGPDA
jgi:hypothetical protein